MNIIKIAHRSAWKIKATLQEYLRRLKYRDKIKENLKFVDKCNNRRRCFVIGNGPSLCKEDLDKIHARGEISFAANRVFKMYDKTSWRPTYYAVCDTTLFKNARKEIEALDGVKFLPLDIYDRYVQQKDKFNVFSRVPFTFFNLPPKFSSNLTDRFGEGGTITYHLLQLAASMGFKEIYLLGIDFSFSYGIGADGKYFEDKTIKHDHFKEDKVPVETMPNLYLNLCAYKKAKSYADKHGIKIYNATRGGKLEVFERLSIDSILS